MGISRCEELLDEEGLDRAGKANVLAFLGAFVAQRGDFDQARASVAEARATHEDLGQRTAAATYGRALLADVELLAGDATAAEQVLRQLCAELVQRGEYSHLASRAGDLAEALYTLGRLDDAEYSTHVAEANAANDDLDAQLLWMPVRAKLLAGRGALKQAVTLGREAVRLAASSDSLNRVAKAHCDLGKVLKLAGRAYEADAAFHRAVKLYEKKENVVGATRTRAQRKDLALV
jgi:tetratricopeptide (TPR) repeat protein